LNNSDARSFTDANPMTAEGFCRGFLELIAEDFSRCDGIPLDYTRMLFSVESPCTRLAGNIAAGRIAFDGTNGATCLQALSGVLAACGGSSTSMQDTGGCEHVLTPLVPVGGTCTSFYIIGVGEQCKDGAYCREGVNYACTGACTLRNPVGGACDRDTDLRCETTATCDTKTKMCVTSPVAPKDGESCGAPNQPSCLRTSYCDTTGVDAGAGIGVCRPRRTSGSCMYDYECANPARCSGATMKVCAAPKSEGDACTPGSRECDLVSHCTSNGKCTNARAPIGQPCGSVDGEVTLCVAGAYCDQNLLSNVAGTCHALKHDGDACTGAPLQECGGDNGHCDPTTHTCASCKP
jgi:hypothetical protein